MRAAELIAAKRDGGVHSAAEIRWLVDGFLDGSVAPEQMSAWCMAVVWRGLDDAEIDALCAAMVESGDVVDLSSLGRTVVDKHSTGGVGDKVTLALAPLVAACGVPVAKMSGRGLGHTGGTLDKLESIPGYRIKIAIPEFVRLVGEVGCAVVAQTSELVPADSALYALRDVTGTVPAPGLIATSVMSKKLASGAHAMVLDVKVGDGAFCRTIDEARELARLMYGLGTRAGRRVVCEITRMDAPLGNAVGNALEVAEAFDVLRGTAPPDVTEVVHASAARLLVLADPALAEEAGARVRRAVSSGAALALARRWIAAQGGDARVVDEPWSVMERAPVTLDVAAPRGGHVAAAGALAIGVAAIRLGAGRSRAGDPVDHAVGIVLRARPGDAVEAGAPLATVHARDEQTAAAAASDVAAAFAIGDAPVTVPDVLLETI
ncbi:MAG: pyrimidine-nucleoside phosphorylase, partial [Gaiellaceae bacterium]|nr:pyrimidine-nucleoside phosphorylase [Gaiellaceae bacterium]